ncbi:MAG: hypothetical protein WAW85_11125 [Gordonia sp. (in: high G+C Gram-positive bacteria)]|uniref:hypothetical protein n=1 Tax=Gordonia sp. (in: high G+C Gram-positive bacteria) TaxID=84139 RepID=UPI003BB7B071
MTKSELHGLLGARLEEARLARNLSLSALTVATEDTPDESGKGGGWALTALTVLGATLRQAQGAIVGATLRQAQGAAQGASLRLLDTHHDDGVNTRIYHLRLEPAAVGQSWPDGTEHLLVTAGRLGIGKTELSAGQSCTSTDGTHEYRALDDRPAAAILVRRTR